MALYSTAGNGTWSVGATWVGGVKPPSGAGNSISIGNGHQIAYDEANGEYGDDTATAFQSQGKLSFSRTATTKLTIYGHMVIVNTVPGNLDMGTTASPILCGTAYNVARSAGITATLVLNKSASLSKGKWGLTVNQQPGFSMVGDSMTMKTASTTTCNAGGTSVTVADLTGWHVGDKIILAETDGSYSKGDTRIITSITLGAGTTGTVSWASGCSWGHAIGCPVMNVTQTVMILPYSTGTLGDPSTSWNYQMVLYFDGAQTIPNCMDVNYAGIHMGGNYYNTFYTTGQQYSTKIKNFSNVSFYEWNGMSMYAFAEANIFSNWIYYTDNTYGNNNIGYYLQSGTSLTGTGWFVNSTYQNLSSANSEGGRGVTFNSCDFWAGERGTFFAVAVGWAFNDCRFHSSWNGSESIGCSVGGTIYFNRCSLYSSNLPGTPSMSSTNFFAVLGGTVNQLIPIVCTDTLFMAGKNICDNVPNFNPLMTISVINKNASLTSQEIYQYGGSIVRDNATQLYRSTSSHNFKPTTSGRALTRTFNVPTKNGVAVRVIGYLYYDATYGSGTPPTATLSGLGITPVTFTSSNISSWNNKFDLSATQTSGADGNLTLTVTFQSTATTGNGWLSGIVDSPFVTSTRHYGFLFDLNIYRTVDPIIQQAIEATVGAYTGITITGTTITVSSNHTIRELYDYCKWYLCQTANQGTTDFFTATDGVNFASTRNIVISGGAILSGTGTITTTGTVSTTGGSTSTVVIAASNGTTGYINITGLSAHTVYLADNSLAQLDYQASVTGTYSYFIPAASTGSWTYVVKKAGYTYQRATVVASAGGTNTIAVSTPQKLNPDGSAMYTSSTSAFCSVSFATTTQASILIGNGVVTDQQIFDTAEAALITNNGMKWLAVNAETSIFLSFGGNYFFMTTKWRLKRNLVGDINATVAAYVQSADGTVVDGTNGGVLFLTSSTASDVWAVQASTVTTSGSMGKVIKLTKNLLLK